MDKKEIYEKIDEMNDEISSLIGRMNRMDFRMSVDWSMETRFKLGDASAKLSQAKKLLSEFRTKVYNESEKKK